MSSQSVSEKEFHQIVHLLGSIIGAPSKPQEKRFLLMEGLCRIVGANSWVWSAVGCYPDKTWRVTDLIHGGFCEKSLLLYHKAFNHPTAKVASSRIFSELEEKGTHLTRTCEQITPDQQWYRPETHRLWDQLNIGPFLSSIRPMEDGGLNSILIFRKSESPPFTEQEAKVAHILLSEVPWLHFQPFPNRGNPKGIKLQPRHRVVLNCLCEGWSRKKIAEHLGLSLHTVHSYSKVVFQHFAVHSQSELIARLTKGNGGVE